MKHTQVEILQQTECPIKGNEPFLSFVDTGVIVNLHDRSGKSHNFLDGWVAGARLPIQKLRKGDILQFQLRRATEVEIPWYEAKLRALLERLEKRRKK